MNLERFRDDVLDVTLKAIDEEPDAWITFNDSLHTRIIRNDYKPKLVSIEKYELPILECDLNDSYLLVTTNRVICILHNQYSDMVFEEMDRFKNDYEALNYQKVEGKYSKINKIAIQKKNGLTFIFLIDSHHPAFFVKLLIYNIFSYKVYGHWYLNPSR